MKRLALSPGIVLLALSLPVLAQPKMPGVKMPTFAPPPPPPASLFWEHPFGDTSTLACTHLVTQHPEGHAGPTLPCAHLEQQHPGGHDTGAKSPCSHWHHGRPDHPGGDPVIVACAHMAQQHPGGHPGPTLPCAHLVQQHPGGHAGPTGPCLHPVPLQRTEAALGINFFMNDSALQGEVIATVQKLKSLGANVGFPRPLNIFNRLPINGNPEDNKDPFWSHYEKETHTLQLVKGRSIADLRQTAHHEIGHALVGHSCVITVNSGGPHTLNDATNGALGISEGWAHFVALAVQNAPGTASATYKDIDWEDVSSSTSSGIPFSKNNEFRAGAILWDLYDSHQDKESLNLDFRELFKVWSPTLETLKNGPVLTDVHDFLTRLKNNHPGKSAQIDAVESLNLTPAK